MKWLELPRYFRTRSIVGAFALALLLAAPVFAGEAAATRTRPPETRRDNVKEVLHGVELVDPYRWLEDQDAPETRAWIETQNKFTESQLASWPGREALGRRLTELLKIDVFGIPTARNGRYFFTKRRADQDLPVLYFRRGIEGEDEVLLDPHPLSEDHRASITLEDVSRDGTLIAYGIRQGGEDEIAIKLMEVDTRKELPDALPRARYFGVSFKPDKSGFYYTRHGAEGSRFFYHALGSEPATDKLIFGESYGPEKIIFGSLSEDGRYLILTVLHGSSADKTEIYFKDVSRDGPVVTVVNDLDARFFGLLGGDTLFLWTNWDAPNSRVLGVDLKNPARPIRAREHWREVIPESDSVIETVASIGGRLFVEYLENVRSVVKIFDPDGEPVRSITFPALGSVSGLSGQWGNEEAFYAFTSYHIPTTIYRYDAARGTQEVWSQLEVPVDTSRFTLRQVWYESKDRTLVPLFLLHKKGIRLDAANPTLLTGYGGFNLSNTPSYSSLAVAWVESGGVFALANLRGGAEFGEKWHQAGMREKKQNVFDDFIAAAEWLIDNGYTSPDKLAIRGASNGGLLVGAALTQRPELFRAVVCRYPLLDMVRYHKFLVAQFWVPEYGSADDPGEFRYLRAYSPYHNVKPGTDYPAVLLVTGDSDTRVAPLHARKMASLLQAATASGRPVLLRYDTKAGHIGAAPVGKEIEELTDELTFLFWQLGVNPSGR